MGADPQPAARNAPEAPAGAPAGVPEAPAGVPEGATGTPDASCGPPTALDLASTPVVAVRDDLDAMAALQAMYRNGVRHLAVLSDTGRPIGLVAAVDLLFGIAGEAPGHPAHVAELCRIPPPRVAPADSAATAARRMIDARTDAVLVMAGDQVRGVLTAVDLMRLVARGGERSAG